MTFQTLRLREETEPCHLGRVRAGKSWLALGTCGVSPDTFTEGEPPWWLIVCNSDSAMHFFFSSNLYTVGLKLTTLRLSHVVYRPSQPGAP